jgi:SAM-dependent methyltransferase
VAAGGGYHRRVAWFEEWFGVEYLDLYAHRDAAEAAAQIAFLSELWRQRPPRRLLDLACGAGRHSLAVRAAGISAVGVDLSLALLAAGRLRAGRAGARLPVVRGDMRRLAFADGSFDWVLNVFTSFGYFARERENFLVLEELVRVLAPEGGFLIDFLNRERALATLVREESRREGDRQIHIQRWFDPVTQRINKRIALARDGEPPRHFLESVRAYRREEVEIGLQWAGLQVTGVYGDFSGSPWTADSERLILVGRKPA